MVIDVDSIIIIFVFRWEVIAQFVNEHSSDACEEKTSAQVIEKVKLLRKLGMLVCVSSGLYTWALLL